MAQVKYNEGKFENMVSGYDVAFDSLRMAFCSMVLRNLWKSVARVNLTQTSSERLDIDNSASLWSYVSTKRKSAGLPSAVLTFWKLKW